MLKRVLSIIVATVLLFTMAIFAFADNGAYLTVEVDQASLRPGDKVTATVQLNNYNDGWGAMSIDLRYDSGLFDLDGAPEDAIDFDNFGDADVMKEFFRVDENTLRFTWMDVDPIEFDENLPLITLKLISKGVKSSAQISANFREGGQIAIDANGNPSPVDEGSDTFSTEPAILENPIVVDGVAWEEQPILHLDLSKNNPQTGRQFKAIISVEKYMPWSTLSIDLDFPAENMSIAEVNPLGFEGNATFTANNVKITNAAANPASGTYYNEETKTLQAVEIVFDALAVSDSYFNLSAAFGSDCLAAPGEDAMVGDVHFQAAGETEQLKIAPAKTLLEVQYAKKDQAPSDQPLTFEAGEEFDVYVNLKEHENEWAAFTLVGNYDPKKFQLTAIDTQSYVGNLGTDEFDGQYQVVEPENLTDDLKVVWVAMGNIKTPDSNPTVMKLTFKALKAGAAEIGFSFAEKGVIAEDESGELQEQTKGDQFAEEEEKVTVNVDPKAMWIEPIVENNLTEVEAGHPVSILLKVRDCYEALTALSIKGTYDTDIFELIGVEPILTEFGEDGAVVTPDIEAGDDLEIVWLNAEDVELPTDFEAVRITLKAKQAADAAAINFNFIESGILQTGAGDLPEPLEKDTYFKTEPETVEISVSAPSVDLEVVYAESNAIKQEDLQAGDTFKVEVYVTDYFAPMAGFAVKGALNNERFKVIGIEAETIAGCEPIQDDNNEEELEFVWMHPEGENIEVGAERFKVITLELEALRSTTGDEQIISFDYIDGGMIRIDGSGNVDELDRGEDFADEPAEIIIEVAKRPVEISLTPDGLAAETKEICAGETFTVDVAIHYYEDDWSSMAIMADFDPADFEIVDAISSQSFESSEGVFAWTTENKNGKPFVAGWVDLSNQALKNGEAVMTVTFRALADAVIDDAMEQIYFSFVPDAMFTCTDAENFVYEPLAEDAYLNEAISMEVQIAPSTDLVQVTVSWGSMEFAYNYGEWDVDAHEWQGSGWDCEDEQNAITVENTGDVNVTAGYDFALDPLKVGLVGEFDKDSAYVPANSVDSTQKVYFTLSGKTQEWEGQQSVGLITVTITADGLEEVPNE